MLPLWEAWPREEGLFCLEEEAEWDEGQVWDVLATCPKKLSLGSYVLSDTMEKCSLLYVRGSIGVHDLSFLLDSGASCNFMSLDLFRTLGLTFVDEQVYHVKLADGTVLKTCGIVKCRVLFGDIVYAGAFHVLPARIPLILGMSFLRDM